MFKATAAGLATAVFADKIALGTQAVAILVLGVLTLSAMAAWMLWYLLTRESTIEHSRKQRGDQTVRRWKFFNRSRGI